MLARVQTAAADTHSSAHSGEESSEGAVLRPSFAGYPSHSAGTGVVGEGGRGARAGGGGRKLEQQFFPVTPQTFCFFITLQPRVESYTSLCALNTSSRRNRFTFLRSSGR